MNKFQILALMMRGNQQLGETNLFSVAALMAEALADIAGKLSEDEFYRLVSIGTAIYSHGTSELGDAAEGEDFFSENDSRPATSATRKLNS